MTKEYWNDRYKNNQTGWDLGGVIKGFQAGLTEFGAATGFKVNEDNSVEWNNDYGIGAIFMPSGLAYYFNSPETIPVYSPLVFQISSYVVNQADHDNDGIPSFMEDLDGDNDVTSDDTDGNGVQKHFYHLVRGDH